MPAFDHDGLTMTCVPDLDAALQAADCVVVVTDHAAYDWEAVAQQARLVVDTWLWCALGEKPCPKPK